MSKSSFDAIIVGAGAMGSAIAYHLTRRGRRALVLDRATPPHTTGSSHGESRMIREAYFEDPSYVPLIQRAYQCWADLEKQSDESLLRLTGGVFAGSRDSEVIVGTLAAADQHGLDVEVWGTRDCAKRFPQFRFPTEMVCVWEKRTGILFPEKCIRAHIDLARDNGATVHFEEPATAWRRDGSGFEVTTPKGVYRAETLVLAAGAWMPGLLGDGVAPLTVTRQVMFWFSPRADVTLFEPARFPAFGIAHRDDRLFYGFPDLGGGPKAAIHVPADPADPDAIDRSVTDEDAAELSALLERYIPDLAGGIREAAVCMYTNTPDGHFIIDRHPEHDRAFVVSPCSGHGFKFSSVIGEVIADLVINDASRFDLSAFGLDRFGQA